MKVTVENYGDEFVPHWVVDVEGFTVIDYGDGEAAYDTAEEYAGKMRKLLARVRAEGVEDGIERTCDDAPAAFAEEQQR